MRTCSSAGGYRSGPDAETHSVVGLPWRFYCASVNLERWTPRHGEHNDYGFGELLGMGRAEIAAIIEAKVILEGTMVERRG